MPAPIRASAGEATIVCIETTTHPILFQSTPPQGRRRALTFSEPRNFTFQSTPPQGRRRRSAPAPSGRRCRFNPRLRRGGDSPAHVFQISSRYWFQSTPPQGRRPRTSRRCSASGRCFNPRLRRGGDTIPGARPRVPAIVSIHASAGEATGRGRWRRRPRSSRFNPRLRRGGDWECTAVIQSPRGMFQSTPPQGRRPADLQETIAASSEFQSTPPQGRRPKMPNTLPGMTKFQSTPPQGRRPRTSRRGSASGPGFNPRLRRGGDPLSPCRLVRV